MLPKPAFGAIGGTSRYRLPASDNRARFLSGGHEAFLQSASVSMAVERVFSNRGKGGLVPLFVPLFCPCCHQVILDDLRRKVAVSPKEKRHPIDVIGWRWRDIWWRNTELNPRPFAEPDGNALALRARIRRLVHFDYLLR